MDRINSINLGFINVPYGKMVEQVFKGKDGQFFFQKVTAQGSNAFQVFNGTG